MNDKFYNLPLEKQLSIMNGAMAVFAKYGYKKTATDEIAAFAGISKGLLFHYFGSKKELFLFLYGYAKDFLVAEMGKDYDRAETDFFKMLANAQMCKLAILKKHPDLMTFLSIAYIETDAAVKSDLGERNSDLLNFSKNIILTRTDPSKFKDNVSVERTLDMILWMSDGLMRSWAQEQSILLEALNDEYLECLSMLRQNFYKEEAL